MLKHAQTNKQTWTPKLIHRITIDTNSRTNKQTNNQAQILEHTADPYPAHITSSKQSYNYNFPTALHQSIKFTTNKKEFLHYFSITYKIGWFLLNQVHWSQMWQSNHYNTHKFLLPSTFFCMHDTRTHLYIPHIMQY